MKKILLIFIITFFIGTLNTVKAQYNHHTPIYYQNTCSDRWINYQIIDTMHIPIMNADFIQSDNIDKDFITNIIPYHQGAIDSAKMILNYTSNKDVRAIAQNIIAIQEEEISKFNILLNNNNFVNSNITEDNYTKFITDEKLSMNNMINKMLSITRTRDRKTTEYTFILAMKYHHEATIHASKQILTYTNDPTIRKIAKKIISEQNTAIKQFDKLIEQGL